MNEDRATKVIADDHTVGGVDIEDLQFTLQETRVLLLQQILVDETGALSVEELDYRNPELSPENIRYHLRELATRDIVEGLEVPVGERDREFPNTFFAVTAKGVRLLKYANLYEELTVWQEFYAQMERTERIKDIESMPNRPTSDLDPDQVSIESPHSDPSVVEGASKTPSPATGAEDSELEQEYDRLKTYFRDNLETTDEIYLKAKFLPDDLGIDPEQFETLMQKLQDTSEFEIEKWSYTSRTTWRIADPDPD